MWFNKRIPKWVMILLMVVAVAGFLVLNWLHPRGMMPEIRFQFECERCLEWLGWNGSN